MNTLYTKKIEAVELTNKNEEEENNVQDKYYDSVEIDKQPD